MRTTIFTPGQWVIAFFDEGRGWWWDIFTRKGFRHCMAFRYLSPLNAWVMVDWSSKRLSVEFLPPVAMDACIVGINDAGGLFLEFDSIDAPPKAIPSFPLYCVSVVKHLLGFRDWKVFTPYQLYCALKKRGAKRIFDLD